MSQKLSRLSQSVRRFQKCEDGSVTIEFVLWLPILVLLISLTADAALIFGNKANVLRVVQDANRAASVGRLRSIEETQNYVRSRMGALATNATITSVIDPNTRVISTTVVIPTNDLIATGFLGKLAGINVTINAQHMLEA